MEYQKVKVIINTYVSLMYEIKKNWKGIYE